MKIMVSACLLGENCKYNGGNNKNPELLRLLSGHTLIPVCPEALGGLPTPRIPAEIVNGTVRNREGVSVDVKEIYDGTFSGRLVPGEGVFAELARRAGFRVADAEDICSGSGLNPFLPPGTSQ